MGFEKPTTRLQIQDNVTLPGYRHVIRYTIQYKFNFYTQMGRHLYSQQQGGEGTIKITGREIRAMKVYDTFLLLAHLKTNVLPCEKKIGSLYVGISPITIFEKLNGF